MEIKLLHTGPLGTNTYVLYGGAEGACAVIDPGGAEPVLAFLREKGLRCTDILLTHGHFDHVLGVAELKRESGARVCINRDDAWVLLPDRQESAPMWGYKIEPSGVDSYASKGDEISAAGFQLRVIETPGHTPGGVCYVLEQPEKVIFSGDTLFCESVGRADLPGGNAAKLYSSIKEELFTLPGDYLVYPGHNRMTTLSHERKTNPYILCGSSEEW